MGWVGAADSDPAGASAIVLRPSEERDLCLSKLKPPETLEDLTRGNAECFGGFETSVQDSGRREA